jgi:hypothetical protein
MDRTKSPRKWPLSGPTGPLAPAVLALFGLVLAAPSTEAQEGVGSIEGIVYDSTQMAPLVGADVVLWNTAHRVRSGGGGVFRFDRIPAGDYTVNFFHPRLAELGVSAGSWQVSVEAGGESFLTLSTPSMTSILVSQCLLEDPMGERARVLGRVVDRNVGTYVPGATVTVSWGPIPGQEGTEGQSSSVTDREGWFRNCDAPPNTPVGVVARSVEGSSPRRELAISPGGAAVVPLDMGVVSPSSLEGQIIDAESRRPIDGAVLRLVGSPYRSFTNESGRFSIEGVHPGEYTLVVEHLQYSARVEGILVGSGTPHTVDVQMATGAIEVDPIVVTAEAIGVERALAMGGEVIPAEEIDQIRQRAADLADLMRLLRNEGLIVRRSDDGTLCVGFVVGQVQLTRGDCEPAMLYIDNTRMVEPSVALSMPAEIVERVILFRPVDAGALFVTGSATGVIMIITRQGNNRVR